MFNEVLKYFQRCPKMFCHIALTHCHYDNMQPHYYFEDHALEALDEALLEFTNALASPCPMGGDRNLVTVIFRVVDHNDGDNK